MGSKISGEDFLTQLQVPAQQATSLDTVIEQLDQRERQIIALCLQGLSAPDISGRLGCSERTVHRLWGRVKQWLEQKNTAKP